MYCISVIIPVFNAEKHIEKCIDSLLSQTLSACEFVFVNDGSSDKSQSIVEYFQKQDSRIKLINQKNQGVSIARNSGIAIAQGDYIGFVDADDYVEKDCFQRLYEIAISKSVAIVISNYFSSQEGHTFTSKALFRENEVLNSEFIQKQIIPYLIGNDNLNAIWNKMYKRELITDNQIWFPKGVPLGEDGWFNLNCFNKADSVFFSDYVGYHYVDVTGSATRNFSGNNYFKRIEDVFQQDFSSFTNQYLDINKIELLKAEKFIKNTIALLHEYFKEKYQINSKKRNELVKEVFNSLTTRQIIKSHFVVLFSGKSKYEQIILLAIKYKINVLLTMAIEYSKFRNKSKI